MSAVPVRGTLRLRARFTPVALGGRRRGGDGGGDGSLGGGDGSLGGGDFFFGFFRLCSKVGPDTMASASFDTLFRDRVPPSIALN